MSIYLHTLISILVLALVILLVVFLRHRGLLRQESGILFSQLVTQITLPALIFSALSHSVIEWQYLVLFLIMLGSEIVLLGIAWGAGRLLGLTQSQMGSFLLVSAFGSSALLGYAIIVELFPDNSNVIAEAAFVSELGVGLPLFTIGVMTMIYYGSSAKKEISLLREALLFFKSPIFLSIAAGMIWSLLELPTKGMIVTPLFDALHIIAKANTFLVAMTVGVLLQFGSFRYIVWIAAAVVMIKLILAPVLVYIPASFLTLESWQMQVLILEASMPSAMLSVVLAKRYGCDAELAAKLVFVTLVVSMLTVTMMLKVLG
ncbi:MAG: AEC family transporter [Campylobacterota bacterium]|nr:AEC family transporter [Campylobacterota bacterium]